MDHISIPVRDVVATSAFYSAALETLGWRRAGFREGVYVAFEKRGALGVYFQQSVEVAPVHLAFRATSEAEVERFHAAALSVGGTDHGAPGPRPDYSDTYFAAFVLDPDGHNVEAVMGGVTARAFRSDT